MEGKQRFPLRPELRKVAEIELAKILANDGSSPRAKLSAIKTLAMLDRLNMEQEKIDRETLPPEGSESVIDQVRAMDQVTAPGE